MARPIPVLLAAFAHAVAVMRLGKRAWACASDACILRQLMDEFTKDLLKGG